MNPYLEIERICKKFGYPAPITHEFWNDAIGKVSDAMQGMEKMIDDYQKNEAEELGIRGCHK